MPRDAGALIRSLAALQKERRTGVLEVTAEGVRTSLYLMEGSVIFAEEDPSLETLGRLLVRQGTLTNEQYAQAIQQMADALEQGEERELRFGGIAVDLGFIDGDQLNDALVEQARWRLVRLFRRSDHEWRLDDDAERASGVPLYDLPIEPAVLLAVRSTPDEDLRDDAVPPALVERLNAFPVLSRDASEIAKAFALGPSERAWVAAIDGSKTVAECLRVGSALVNRAAILTALLLTRGVKLVDRPLSAGEEPPPSSRRMPAAVATTPQAPPPPPLSKPTSPAVAAPPGRPTTAMKAVQASRVNSELALQKGNTLMRSGELEGALEEFRRAQSLDPTPEIELHLRWTEIQISKRPLTEAQRADLQRLAVNVSRLHVDNALAAYVIGRIAGLEGRPIDSKRWLERAFRLEPKLREMDADRSLKELLEADEKVDAGSPKRGMLGWFRRNEK